MAEAEVRSEHEAEHEHGSPWPFVVAIGAAIAYVGLVISIPLLVFGVIVFLAGAVGWLRDDLHSVSRAVYGGATAVAAKFRHVSDRKLAVWLLLATEVMFFSALIGTSWTLRFRTSSVLTPWALPGQVLDVPITALNTFILFASSLTMVEALASIERGDQKRMRRFLICTLLLGIAFLAIQAREFYTLYFIDGLTFTHAPDGINSLYGPTFFVQTGTHGAHVLAGVFALSYTTIKAWRGGFTKENHEAVELVALYWNFVDVVWIFLFTIVYLI
jgi:heme/copper-type cytochrome/quinol oxidase subunit 3